MTTESLLDLPLLANNQVNQFAVHNEALEGFAKAEEDVLPLTMSVNIALTDEQFTRAKVFACSGHVVARDLTIVARKRVFMVHNLGTASGVLNVVCGSTSVALAVSSAPAVFYTDGTADGVYKAG